MTTTPEPADTVVPADAGALTVLHRAERNGYVLLGPHDRIARLDLSHSPHPVVVDIGRHEHDTVHALTTSGLLQVDVIGGTFTVRDGPDQRRGYGLVLTPHGRHALDTAPSPVRCQACHDTGQIRNVAYPEWSPTHGDYRRQPSSSPCHRCPAGRPHP
ncbi:MAG: hypothetical protein ACRDRK_01245 [Pseudonocardia sp.]